MAATPADIFSSVSHFRSELLKRDAQTSAHMVRLYSEAARRIERRVLQLAEQRDQAIARGERVSPSWLYQQQRLQALLTQVQNEIHRFAADAGPYIAGVQRDFALAGFSEAQDVITLTRDQIQRTRGVASPETAAAHVGFAKLAAEAATDLAGFAADGSPLSDLLGALGPAAADEIKQALFAGIVQGLGAQQLARQVRNSLGGNMQRAMLIGRTETLRAYRESSQRFYEDNADVVRAWRWVSACNARTCAVCWAMHGSVHTVDEQFVSHPGCRCTPVPVTDLSPGIVTGPARFATLNEKIQLQVLGPKKFAAYKNGEISLTSLAGMKDNGRWGATRVERNLKDAIKAEKHNTPLPVGPSRGNKATAPIPPTPPTQPKDPLEALIPTIGKQQPAATASEARQRVIDIRNQYDGALSTIKDELKQNQSALRAAAGKPYADLLPMFTRQNELLKLRGEVTAARDERHQDILSVAQPAQFNVKMTTRDKARKAIWTKGVDAFKKLVGIDLTGKSVTLKSGGRGRSNYDLKGNINVAVGDPFSVVVHELGHWLEDMSPEVHRKTIDFLQRRTAGETPKSLKQLTNINYHRSERAWRDKWMDAYVGKEYRRAFSQGNIYNDLYATEVVSMGLQWYVEQPAEFALQDPDFFDFIFDLVRGR